MLGFWNVEKDHKGRFDRYPIIPSFQCSNIPLLHDSITPILQDSILPSLRYSGTPLFRLWVLVATIIVWVWIIPAIRVGTIVAITIWGAIEPVAGIVPVTHDGVAIPPTVVHTAGKKHCHPYQNSEPNGFPLHVLSPFR
jgi:hypothetical protein